VHDADGLVDRGPVDDRQVEPDPATVGVFRVEEAVSATDWTLVDHHLRRLGPQACRAFVADLWADRGFETRVENEVVVATRRGERVVIYPTCGGVRRSSSQPGRPVDVVVAPRGGDAVATVADAHDARLVTARDLRLMLRYAVDPADADELCLRHLGAPPAGLRPPLRGRIRRRTEHVSAASPSLAGVVAMLALVVLTVGGFAAVGLSDPTADSGEGDATVDASTAGRVDDRTTDGPDEPVETGSHTAWSGADDDRTLAGVPGVGSDGVTDLTALAAAHDRALGDRSYTLWLDTYRPRNGEPGASRTQHDTDITVEGDRYLVAESIEGADGRRLVRTIYYDGTDWYVDDRSAGDSTVRWIDGTGNTSVQPDPRTLRETLVTRHLATPTTEVTERVQRDGTARYRIEGEGRPRSFAAEKVYNYSVVAFVDETGLVRDATVGFTVVTLEGSYRLRFEWTYGRIDATTVTRPEWSERALSPTRSVTDNRTAESTS
jgi:hypothetical protein